MFNKILVPLDGSEVAEAILPHVTALASCTGAELILLQVIPRVGVPTRDLRPSSVADMAFSDPVLAHVDEEASHAQAEAYLSRVQTQFKLSGYNVTTQIGEGPVAATIFEAVKQNGADLIAMSTHGRSGFARLVMGSVADDVVRGAGIPVLLVRPWPVKQAIAERQTYLIPVPPPVIG